MVVKRALSFTSSTAESSTVPDPSQNDLPGDTIPDNDENFGAYEDGSLNSESGILDNLLSNVGGEDETSIWIKQLLTDENLLMKTDVPERAIPALAKGIVLGKKYRSQRLFDYIIYYLRLRISRNREGRKELVAMALRTKGRDDGIDDFS